MVIINYLFFLGGFRAWPGEVILEVFFFALVAAGRIRDRFFVCRFPQKIGYF